MNLSEKLTKLISAAVVDAKFSKLLLNDPAQALKTEIYGGEQICFEAGELKLILAAQENSRTLSEFAMNCNNILEQHKDIYHKKEPPYLVH